MNIPRQIRTISLICPALVLAACNSGGTKAGTGVPNAAPDGPSTPVTATEAIPDELRQSLQQAEAVDAASLQVAYPPPVAQDLGYDPKAAAGLDLIQASPLALNERELDSLGRNGLVISKRQKFPSFSYGYKSIYFADLPVYVSADSILEAVHRTFDSLLEQTEQTVLMGNLSMMLDGMRSRLATSSVDAQTAKDGDLYLTVAASLLRGHPVLPLMADNAGLVGDLYQSATSAIGHKPVKLFGVSRDEDFSQFQPRGHYTRSDALKQYFRAMMWLGRVDLRLIETQPNGTQLFYRRQFDAAVALRELLGESEYKLWEGIDTTIGAYVGEHDSMTPKDIDGLMSALGVTSLRSSLGLTDQQIIDELARGGWGAQRIASRIIIKGNSSAPTLPLDRSFLLFGQRYTVDSHVFVNVTFDRVGGRWMPQPLDAAFAALGNNAALPRLENEFGNLSYVQGLAKSRTLIDAHESAYWEGSLYTRWLGALQTLSPAAGATLPSVATTAAWQARMLSAQLGSWAQLRHDTILYVKQSYTTGAVCEFPDAYVDPYPEFYAKLGAWADAVDIVSQTLPASADSLKATARQWVTSFKAVTNNLQKMAEDQKTGTPHSAELLAFINDAVKWDEQVICGGVNRTNLAGWYLNLFLDRRASIEYDPTVADVHTQPTDAAGNDVGRVLHVGTGFPRLMVVTVDTCQGPRAFAGLAYSYGERITDGWVRLTDEQWANEIARSPFPDVNWMSDVLAE